MSSTPYCNERPVCRLRRALTATAVVAAAALCAPAARAALTLYDGDKGKLELEARFQFWATHSGPDIFVSPQDEAVDDFFLRRARLVLSGKMSEKLSIYLQVGQDNINRDIPTIAGSTKLPTEDSGLKVKDFCFNYKARDGFQLTVGQFKIPYLRSNLESGWNQILVDRALLPGLRPAREGTRDVGGMVWGNRGGFQYRAALFDGSDQEDSNPSGSLRGSARVSYNWFTPEADLGYTGTTIGEKKILQIAGQADFQGDRLDSRDDSSVLAALPRDYRAWAAEVFYDQPFGDGRWAFTFEGAWIDREDDYADPATPDRAVDGYYAQAGFLLPGKVGPGRLQVAGRYESFDSERGAATSRVERRTAGINWYAKKHERKIQLDYTQSREEPEPTELRDDEYRLSLLLSF